MTKLKHIAFLLLTVSAIFPFRLNAQERINPIADYSFNTGEIKDDSGNSELSLRNNAEIFTDPQRGNVLRFSSVKKSYAVFNRQLLNSGDCTISFFFYWENEGATFWHQVFEIHNLKTNSNLYFTPLNGWGKNECSIISDSKNYGKYENTDAKPLQKNTWMHIAVVFQQKQAKIYINGKEESTGNMMFTPETVYADSLYIGGNPHRSNNYYISARIDDLKIFNRALSPLQVSGLNNGETVSVTTDSKTVWETDSQPVKLTVDLNDTRQTIHNFGSSDAWNTEKIGKYWPQDKKEKLAELLFSTSTDNLGNPIGIGLSAWRFNIGAGTAEQGTGSRITSASRRTECFLNTDKITYNWSKQAGQQFFLYEAVKKYNVQNVIGWVNSPPVMFTEKNLGFREFGAPVGTILKREYFDDYARFLADVTEYFKTKGITFHFISPLNEPQWDWSATTAGGTLSQEGSPWTNQEIFDVALAVDAEFSKRNLNTKILLTEAGSIEHIIKGSGHASNQLSQFWNPFSSLSLTNKKSFSNIIAYHSYWRDNLQLLEPERKELVSRTEMLNNPPTLWQSEYSLLGSGYRDGNSSAKKMSEMDCALSMARVILADLNLANASAWQWWTTFEEGKHDGESRFALIEAFTNKNNSDGEFHANKLFYAFGNFSNFIRPGMVRISASRTENRPVTTEYNDIVFSAFKDTARNQVVLVAANFSIEPGKIDVQIKNAANLQIVSTAAYITDRFSNLKNSGIEFQPGSLVVPARSVVTFKFLLSEKTSAIQEETEIRFTGFINSSNQIISTFDPEKQIQSVVLYSVTGNVISCEYIESGQNRAVFPASHLPDGLYLLCGKGKNFRQTVKLNLIKQ